MSLVGSNPQNPVNIKKSNVTESEHYCIEISEEIVEDISPCQIYCIACFLLIAYFMPYILIIFMSNAYSHCPIG